MICLNFKLDFRGIGWNARLLPGAPERLGVSPERHKKRRVVYRRTGG
jgi:hypothetical protein